MSGRRLIEIFFALLIGVTVYCTMTRRPHPPKREADVEDETNLPSIEAAFTTGSASEVWAAIDQLEKFSNLPERAIKDVADRLCRFRNAPEFDLLRSKLHRTTLPAAAIGLNCDGT